MTREGLRSQKPTDRCQPVLHHGAGRPRLHGMARRETLVMTNRLGGNNMSSTLRRVALGATLAVAYALVVAGFGTSASAATTTAYPAHIAAPYLQISTVSKGQMKADMDATGQKYYTLAFLDSESGCTPEWEDGSEAVKTFEPVVKKLQKAGGNVIISFGGSGSTELAETCTSVSSLESAYAAVLSAYPGVTRLDFDIEQPAITNSGANSRRNKALALLQKKVPSTSIDYTLAVSPTGLPASPELSLVKQAIKDGVRLNEVNIMAQYFGSGDDLADAESAATGTEQQLAQLYPSLSTVQVWDMIGITPVASASYGNDESFTTSDATQLEMWAADKGVQELAFWEVYQYDRPTGYQYSEIFEPFTS